jgi:hypothetical protein
MTRDEWVKISIVVAAYAAWICFAVIVERNKERERGNSELICQYPIPQEFDFPLCEFKLRDA